MGHARPLQRGSDNVTINMDMIDRYSESSGMADHELFSHGVSLVSEHSEGGDTV
jgi:hypothetical protein